MGLPGHSWAGELYIISRQFASAGETAGQPAGTPLGEVRSPVERARREVVAARSAAGRRRRSDPGVSLLGCLEPAVSMEGVTSSWCQTTGASRGEGWRDWVARCGRPEETTFQSFYFSVMQTN